MSGRANQRRATVWSGYFPIGKMSCRVIVSRATILRANVRSGCCPSGYCPVGLLSVGDVSSGKCPVGLLSGNHSGHNKNFP